MNGALTIGTLDGANVEMMEEMGEENIFIFGMRVDDVENMKKGGTDASLYYNRNPELKQCIDQIRSGYFSPNKPEEFHHLVDVLIKWDRFYTLADYDEYIKCQDRVNEVYAVSLNTSLLLLQPGMYNIEFVHRTKHSGRRWLCTTLPLLENFRVIVQSLSMPVKSGG